MPIWLVILIGVMGGVAVGLQSPIAGAMGQRIGGIAGSFIIHVSGAIFSGLLLFLRGGEKLKDWSTLPWYMPCAGIFGLLLYITISITLPRVGSTMMVVLIIIGQLVTGVVVDHFGLLGVPTRPVDLLRVIGVVVLVLGAYLVAQ
jgi:bacterial/archaeal transporter family-2 protein